MKIRPIFRTRYADVEAISHQCPPPSHHHSLNLKKKGQGMEAVGGSLAFCPLFRPLLPLNVLRHSIQLERSSRASSRAPSSLYHEYFGSGVDPSCHVMFSPLRMPASTTNRSQFCFLQCTIQPLTFEPHRHGIFLFFLQLRNQQGKEDCCLPQAITIEKAFV